VSPAAERSPGLARLPVFTSLAGYRPGWLRKRGVRLVLAGEIGQVRDMLAAVGGRDGAPEYHRTVAEAVTAARMQPDTEPAREE
jgi:hypothetical protein